ncbi:MAG: hypothetical protein GXP25_23670 [Planctomycetes bacterium]|nr:hypothetical protein [Planctomycetota bacterium]
MRRLSLVPVVVPAVLFFAIANSLAGIESVPLQNPSFEEGAGPKGVPVGWRQYSGGPDTHIRLIHVAGDGKQAVLIEDDNMEKETGLTQTLAVKPGLTYETTVSVRRVEGASPAGAYLQMRFLPSNEYSQKALYARSERRFTRVSLRGTAPPDTKQLVLYLYTHRGPRPKVVVDWVRVVSGVDPPPPPPPAPVPPVYSKLKNLYIHTELVKGGKPNATIVAPASGKYADLAKQIQGTIAQATGVTLPIVKDTAPEAAVPIKGHLIALGNRSTNKTIEKLYNFYYTLLDLRYPGPEGYVVRTLHNPFGDGRNVVFVGGSDDVGVKAGTDVFVKKIQEAKPRKGALTLGRLMEIRLGKGIEVPTDVKDFETWEASRGYRSTGYFGWNSISKQMAMYYMTGNEHSAREVIRLAFPDKKARQEISDIDGERIENKDEPLSGPYHYNAHMMILFWDLIEESPVFTDEERLRVTNAFSKQLLHRKDEGIYRLTQPPRCVGSRHGQWSAVSLYCLGRYFQTYYPNPIWKHCVESAKLHFGSLHDYAWVGGESDNLFWYNTGHAPILTYMLLTGDRKPLENGVLRTLLRGQEILFTGRENDWDLRSASIGFLHKAAYLLQDGRWIWYRERTGVDMSIFRLGQSYWPDKDLAPTPPTDLIGKWSIFQLSEPAWEARNNGFPLEHSFAFGSFRTALDASGDYILIDGFNGASRNPYHCFAVLRLRIDGNSLLDGYLNQVLTRADGMVEPKVAMNGALRYRNVIGPTAVCVGEVPDAAYCNWRRTLVQRTGKYALFVDDMTFRTDSDNMEVQIKWENSGKVRRSVPAPGVLALQIPGGKMGTDRTAGQSPFFALDAQCTHNLKTERPLVRLEDYNTLLLRSPEPGGWIEMPFELKEKPQGELFVNFLKYKDRGIVQVKLDGKPVGKPTDLYAPDVAPGQISLGRDVAAGKHVLRVETVGSNPNSGRCYVGLVGISVRKAEKNGRPPAFDVCLSDPVATTTTGRVTTMKWLGGVKKEQHRIFFTAIARNPLDPKTGAASARLADNAAALALPEAALAVAGKYADIEGELVVLAEGHLFGKGLRQAGGLVRADAPVAIDWNFGTGDVNVVTDKVTTIHLLTEPEVTLTLDQGTHRVQGTRPPAAELAKLKERLTGLLAKARKVRVERSNALGRKQVVEAPAMKEGFVANVKGKVVDLITIPSNGGRLICAAEGKTVHVLSADGKEVRTMQTDGNIRMLRWWAEHKLLLAGCDDEKVIAFDEQGKRKWVFVSEMDPAVFRAAKTYWFKSAPGHKGIHGLYTGVFLDGKSQAFVGSACTLEILDENGKLLHRMPQFWGDETVFTIVDGPDGSLNLLGGRVYSGNYTVLIVNNKTLKTSRGFVSVPKGHTYVGGWASMNRAHLFYVDLDGDGVKEVVSEINGTWNRVSVWTARGKALYNAQFGPGRRIRYKNMRDLDIADLDGDGKKEILTATSSGLVVALNHKCEKVWATKLPASPTVMKVMAPGAKAPQVVVGCQGGSVYVLDAKGSIVRTGKITGTPTRITALDGTSVLLATDKGEVKKFEIGE